MLQLLNLKKYRLLLLFKQKLFLNFLTIILIGTNSAFAAVDGYKLPRPDITSDFPYASQYIDVLGTSIHYVEQGQGNPVLFIHGNPTSSYLWRNIIPFASKSNRAIALDLVGMGQSGKPDINYTFQDHYQYLEKFIEALDLKNITLVVHDWGAALGFEYARRHEDNIAGITFFEGALPPIFPANSSELSPFLADFINLVQDPVLGPQFIIEQNGFVEQVIPQLINRPLTEIEMNHYREPYLDIAARKPVFTWPQELPIDGVPERNVLLMNKIKKFMKKTKLPMLLLYGSPGTLVSPELVPTYISLIKNLDTVYVGQGFHYLQEDQPVAIGRALVDWMLRNIKHDE